ncbi:transcriptional repressor LexA [bacterium]|nr:transcriptional repressor LexA [bacterium]
MKSRIEKVLTAKELELLRHLRNSIVHQGDSPSVRDLQDLMKYQSPRSVTKLLDHLQSKGIVKRRADKKLIIIKDPESHTQNASTVDVPLIGRVACGVPLLAEQNIEAMIPVSTQLARSPHTYFLLRAHGDSMNAAGINNGDIVLIKQTDCAKNGEIVVALIDSEATIKKFRKNENAIFLEPQSTDPIHKPIILHSDFRIQGIVVTSLGD